MKIKIEPGPKLETNLTDFWLEASPNRARVDEAVNLKTTFRITGGLQDVFNPDVWDRAIDMDDEHLRLFTSVSILKRSSRLLDRVVIKPIVLKRKATFYWTRDPQNPYRVWVMVVDEELNPHIPEGLEEAMKNFFQFDRKISIFGSSLGKGKHVLYAEASVKWSRHFYIEKGIAKGTSNPVHIEVT